MKQVSWDKEKNKIVKKERDVSFEDVLFVIQEEKWLDILDHPNKKKYPYQRIFIIAINNYAYMVPFVEDEEKFFLKTIIPSRKMTRKYIKKGGVR